MSEFQEKVNEVASAMTQDDKGTWVIPEGVEASEEVRFAANLEKRRRDTQSAYTKQQAQVKQLEVERDRFAQGWEADFSKNLDTNQQAELEELKATDPDAWRYKLNEYEQDARTQFQEKKQEISTAAQRETETEQRARQLKEWQEANPGLTLTDDTLANDIPPRITRELEEGKVSFNEFLANCATYLNKGKVVKGTGDKAQSHGSLSSVSGGSAPAGDAVAAAVSNDYKNMVF